MNYKPYPYIFVSIQVSKGLINVKIEELPDKDTVVYFMNQNEYDEHNYKMSDRIKVKFESLN